jgi:hypothetical protein
MNTARKPEPEVHVHDASKSKGRLKALGGSMSDDWNNILANQAVQTLWLKSADAEEINRQRHAAVDVLIGMAPQDEFEGMVAGQLVACHNASMECYRRAMITDQTFEGRRENLNQANKLSRTYATLLEFLNRHRGKGQQKVTVEHVHVHAGGQAVVGTVEHQGGGDQSKSEGQPHAKQITHAPQLPMRSTDKKREPVPVARDAERPMPDARGTISGRSEGE